MLQRAKSLIDSEGYPDIDHNGGRSYCVLDGAHISKEISNADIVKDGAGKGAVLGVPNGIVGGILTGCGVFGKPSALLCALSSVGPVFVFALLGVAGAGVAVAARECGTRDRNAYELVSNADGRRGAPESKAPFVSYQMTR